MLMAPDAFPYSSFEPKYRLARVNLQTNTTTYETRQFSGRRHFLESLAAWTRAGLLNQAGPIWAYYEAPSA
jgi:hypothetical protein